MAFSTNQVWKTFVPVMAGAMGFSAALAVPQAFALEEDGSRTDGLVAQADMDVQEQNTTIEPVVPTEAEIEPPSTEDSGVSPSPESDPTTDSATTGSISPEELEQFANTIPQLVAIEQAGQEQVFQVIDESGLERDRFYEIYQGQTQPSPAGSADASVTTEEQTSFETTLSRIEQIEQDIQSQQSDVIKASGIDPERFNEIMSAVLNDPELQLQVEELITQ